MSGNPVKKPGRSPLLIVFFQVCHYVEKPLAHLPSTSDMKKKQ
jgi:hypothetical protein